MIWEPEKKTKTSLETGHKEQEKLCRNKTSKMSPLMGVYIPVLRTLFSCNTFSPQHSVTLGLSATLLLFVTLMRHTHISCNVLNVNMEASIGSNSY